MIQRQLTKRTKVVIIKNEIDRI